MSVMTHDRLSTHGGYKPRTLSPQQKAAIVKVFKRAGYMLLGATITFALVGGVIGLKAFIYISRLGYGL